MILPRHVRRRRASFVLTSLIDVIFLLVIFFMVSSQIVPFSVIGLGPVASDPSEPQLPPAPSAATQAAPVAVRIMAGSVRVAGETIAMTDLDGELERLKADGVTALVLIPAGTATVQDVVSVLEGVKAAGIETVTVLKRRGARP